MSFLQPEMKSTENLGHTPTPIKVPFMGLFFIALRTSENQYIVAKKGEMILHIVLYEPLTPR